MKQPPISPNLVEILGAFCAGVIVLSVTRNVGWAILCWLVAAMVMVRPNFGKR